METKFGAERRTNYPHLAMVHDFLKLGDHLPLADPTKLTTFERRPTVIGVGASELRKIRSVFDATLKLQQPLLSLSGADQGVRFDQDMAYLVLVNHDLLAIALIDQLYDVITVWGRDDAAIVTNFHGADGIGKQRRNFGAFAPAQVAAFQSLLAV